MHQYSGVKKGYRPARTSRGYRSFFPSSIHASPSCSGVISSRELAVHNVGLNGYEERGAPIGSRAGRVGVPTGTLTR